MNILLINDNYFPLNNGKILGGLEKALLEMAKILSDDGNNIYISTSLDSDNDFRDSSNKVYAEALKWDTVSKHKLTQDGLSTRQGWDGVLLRSLTHARNSLGIPKFDLVISHTKTPTMLNALVKFYNESKIPTIAYIHNLANFGMLSVETNKAFKRVRDAGILTVTVSECSRLDNNACVEDCCQEVHCLQYYDRLPPTVWEADDYNIIIGRITPFKNIPLALLTASKSKYPTRFYTTSNPGESNKELYDTCMNIVKNNPNIILQLNIPHHEIMMYLAHSRAHILTSLGESASISTFEASLSGVPTVFQIKNDNQVLAPNMFTFDYSYKTNTYRKQAESASTLLANLVDSVDIDFEKRKQLSEMTVKTFTKEKWLNDFYRLVKLVRK